MKKLMSPTTPKAESDIADAIERWMESGRMLENLKQEYRLPEPFKVTALEQLMGVGQAKLHFESIKTMDMGFDSLLQKCRGYALRRRLEHNHRKGKDDMDVDAVSGGTDVEMDMGGGQWEHLDWEVALPSSGLHIKGQEQGQRKVRGMGQHRREPLWKRRLPRRRQGQRQRKGRRQGERQKAVRAKELASIAASQDIWHVHAPTAIVPGVLCKLPQLGPYI